AQIRGSWRGHTPCADLGRDDPGVAGQEFQHFHAGSTTSQLRVDYDARSGIEGLYVCWIRDTCHAPIAARTLESQRRIRTRYHDAHATGAPFEAAQHMLEEPEQPVDIVWRPEVANEQHVDVTLVPSPAFRRLTEPGRSQNDTPSLPAQDMHSLHVFSRDFE